MKRILAALTTAAVCAAPALADTTQLAYHAAHVRVLTYHVGTAAPVHEQRTITVSGDAAAAIVTSELSVGHALLLSDSIVPLVADTASSVKVGQERATDASALASATSATSAFTSFDARVTAHAATIASSSLTLSVSYIDRALQRVYALHCPMGAEVGGPICHECLDELQEPLPWPCPTIRAIEGAAE